MSEPTKKKNTKTTSRKKTTPATPNKETSSIKRNENNLTEKQELFCRYYLDCGGNATEAYRMAYDTSNMADETIWSKASELKNYGKVTVRIEELKAERQKATEVDRQKVQAVLMDIVSVSVDDLYFLNPANGNVKSKKPHQLPKRVKRALARMKLTKDGVDYVFQDKVSAAKTLGKWNGWEAPVKNEHTVNGAKRVIFADLPEFYNEEESDE